jgi:hypothetical protein
MMDAMSTKPHQSAHQRSRWHTQIRRGAAFFGVAAVTVQFASWLRD